LNLNAIPTGTIKGEIYYSNSKLPVRYGTIEIKSLKKGSYIDSIGNFEIKNIEAGVYDLKLHVNYFDDSTLNNIRVNSDSVTDLKISFVSNCQYSRSDSICPVCKKIDKVIPIVYGLIVFENDKTDTTDNSGSIIEEEQSFKMGGCNVTGCDPFWYCRRDSISF
jgi:hypothetical protein